MTSAWREPGALLLVSCYELGHPPLGIAWPKGFLERAGFAPAVLDLSVEPLDEEKVRRARWVGVSTPMHTALRIGARLAERVRALNPACHITFYGLYAWLNADALLGEGKADSVDAGESERALVARVEGLEAGAAPGGRPAAPALEKLAFVAPSREGLAELGRYARFVTDGEERLAGYVEASRGCLHRCRHCPIPPVYGGRFFVVPAVVVLADIRRQVAAGARHITFGDPDFLNGPGHALAVARALHAEFPHLSFDVTAKVEHLVKRAEMLPELGRLGCAFIVSAVESLSDAVLAALDKGHTRADVHRALEAVRAAGIALRPTWVPFTPWAGAGDYLEMLDFVEREDLVDAVDPVQYAVRLLVPPGSMLLRSPEMLPHLGRLVPGAFHYQWTHPDPRMDRLHAAVSALVEAAAASGAEIAVTFERVRALAGDVLGAPPPSTSPRTPLAPSRRRAPRLTEPWFC